MAVVQRGAQRAAPLADGPVTLEEAKALVQARAPRHAMRSQTGPLPAASPAAVGEERKNLREEERRERERRISEYKATMEIMKARRAQDSRAPAQHRLPGRRTLGGAAIFRRRQRYCCQPDGALGP